MSALSPIPAELSVPDDAPLQPSPGFPLAFGRRLELQRCGGVDALVVVAEPGRVELVIRLTEAGPVIEASAAALKLGAVGELSVECGSFRVRAREEAAGWQTAVRTADASRKEIGGQRVALDFADGEGHETIAFLGSAYRREPSTLSGATRITFDETTPETWTVPLVTEVKPKLVVTAPRAGYLIPPAYAPLFTEKLALHGFTTVPVKSARTGVAVEVFKASEAKFAETSYEAHQRVEVKGAWSKQTCDVAAGSLFIPVAQPGAPLLLHLLEPEAPDSLVAWGFLNAVFEQKEYMESYVAEEIGETMLRDDPALRVEFEKALADPAFAADPKKRLDFFYRRSPYWDTAKDVVPILRVDAF